MIAQPGFLWPRGTRVFKHTGDYQIEGTVVGHAEMLNGAVRYVVEHEAAGGGSFLHVYADKNLKVLGYVPPPSATKAPA